MIILILNFKYCRFGLKEDFFSKCFEKGQQQATAFYYVFEGAFHTYLIWSGLFSLIWTKVPGVKPPWSDRKSWSWSGSC